MFKFLKSSSKTSPEAQEIQEAIEAKDIATENTGNMQKSFFSQLKQKLTKTRQSLTEGIVSLFLGRKAIEPAMLEELEQILLKADLGESVTSNIISDLTNKLNRQALKDPTELISALKQDLLAILSPYEQKLIIPEGSSPFMILIVGVNGVGKTTMIGKLAKLLQAAGKKVLLAAGDTFRAAAIEQLQIWGEKNSIPVLAQHSGADSASVVYDAFNHAKAKNFDVLIADTAGRMHTKDNLMQELQKISRVLKKLDPLAPHETMLVLDASIGQNAVIQASKFHEAIKLTSISITKLDGTAKGGVIFSIANQLKLPIRFIGVGEGVDDLKEFKADLFTAALFDE